MDLEIVLKTKGNKFSAGKTPVMIESKAENLWYNVDTVVCNNPKHSAVASLTRKAAAKYICICLTLEMLIASDKQGQLGQYTGQKGYLI